MDFLELAPNKILNKVICDFHFKENNFMNYKRERLTKTNAVPTIFMVPGTSEEIDLSVSPTDWVEKNRKKALPESFKHSSQINIDESSDLSNTIQDEETKPPAAKKKKLDVASNVIRILNGTSATSGEVTVQKIFPKKIPILKQPAQNSTKVLKVSGSNYTIRQVPSSPAKPQSTSTPKPKILTEVIDPAMIQDFVEIPQIEFIDAPSVNATMVSSNGAFNEDLKPVLMDSLKQISEIKEMLNKKQSEVNASPTLRVEPENSNISQSHMNKVQLFNGIKRYLSPSMIALLRMELFAAPGREYKKDEKIICQELLSLGEAPYNFIADEWRLRLPAKSDVQEWANEMTEEDDDAN